MADELIAKIDRARMPPILDVVATLTSDDFCIIESAREDEVLLRWADAPRRSNWPEDFSLSVIQDGLLLSIHAGTRDQRASIIARIEAYLSKTADCPVMFDDE